jgi:hypothetical protein
MNSKEKFFTRTDAWVFASLRGTIGETGFSFASFLATANMLNHAIPTQEEIKQGFAKLHMRGLIEIENESITKTDMAETLYSKVDKKRGGLFSVIGNCFDVLNSPRMKLPYRDTRPDLEFITPKYINDKYKEYMDRTNSRSNSLS